MKLLVFAHVPPPHHGQSQMVQYLVEGFRRRPELGIEVLHVDARLSSGIEDVGSVRGGKLWRLLGHCREALHLQRQQGVRTLYYVPSPPKRGSLYRDWIVLALLRRRFPGVVFHWHAVGLARWLETRARPWERRLSHRLLDRPEVSLVLAEATRHDGDAFASRQVVVVPNAIPDPCPDFSRDLAVLHRERRSGLGSGPTRIRVLFLSLCSRDKGVFDAVEAVAAANAAAGPDRRFHLTVAGTFPDTATEREFRERIARPDVRDTVEVRGFLSGPEKAAAWRGADVFLFPTYYANEGQPVVLLEAMAHGVPVVSTRWRGIPELLPAGYPGLVEPRSPAAAAAMLRRIADADDGLTLRREFERRFSLDRHLEAVARAVRLAETPQS